MKILIGMPSASGAVPTLTAVSLFALQRPCSMGLMTADQYRTDHARNLITKEFMKGDWDYLFFLDDDNPVPKDTLIKLLEDDKDIVGVPILTRRKDKEKGHWLCAFYGQSFNELRLFTQGRCYRYGVYAYQAKGFRETSRKVQGLYI